MSMVGGRPHGLLALLLVLLWAVALAQSSSASDEPSSATVAAPEETYNDTCPSRDPNVASRQKHVVFVSIAIKGHALPLLHVASEMTRRGYRVSFATHESGRDWVQAHGVRFLSVGAFPISADDLRSKLRAMTRDSSNFRGILTMFSDVFVAAARPMYDTLLPQLQQSPLRPDLVVTDIASIGAQELAQTLGVPFVINSPSILFDLGDAPSYIPAWGTGFSIHMSLWNRCLNILFPRLLSVALTPPFMQLNKMRWELQLKPYRSQHELFKNARVLLNTAFGLDHPQPLSPLVEPIGPLLPVLNHTITTHSISPALKNWINQASPASSSTGGGVIYLNLGTMAYIDSWQAEAIIEGLVMRGEDPAAFRVLWVLPTDQRNVLPNDLRPSFLVKSPSAVSHLGVLAQPNVKLVISHCGMVSAQEALIFHKPLLCIPFLNDQPDVAARVVDSGAGLALDKNLLAPQVVYRAVVQLLANASFKRAAQRVGTLLERAGGTNRAIEIIDAELRLGSQHLETVDLVLPWHKTAMLDVYTVYLALLCILAVCLRVQWLMICFVLSEVFGFVCAVLFGPQSPESGLEDDEKEEEVLQSTAVPTAIDEATRSQ